MTTTTQQTTIEQIDWNHWIYRLIAIIIDAVIIAIPTWIIQSIITAALIFSSGFIWWFAWGSWLIFLLIDGVIWVLYSVILEVAWGATIGKKLLGLQVQMVNGARVTASKSFIRNLSKIIPPLVLLDWLVGIVTEGDKRQKFLDRVAGTTVVPIAHVKQPFASSAPPPPPPPPPPA